MRKRDGTACQVPQKQKLVLPEAGGGGGGGAGQACGLWPSTHSSRTLSCRNSPRSIKMGSWALWLVTAQIQQHWREGQMQEVKEQPAEHSEGPL